MLIIRSYASTATPTASPSLKTRNSRVLVRSVQETGRLPEVKQTPATPLGSSMLASETSCVRRGSPGSGVLPPMLNSGSEVKSSLEQTANPPPQFVLSGLTTASQTRGTGGMIGHTSDLISSSPLQESRWLPRADAIPLLRGLRQALRSSLHLCAGPSIARTRD